MNIQKKINEALVSSDFSDKTFTLLVQALKQEIDELERLKKEGVIKEWKANFSLDSYKHLEGTISYSCIYPLEWIDINLGGIHI